MSVNPFVFVEAINSTKKNLLRTEGSEVSEKDYLPFTINKALSYFPDTVMYANDMNQCYLLDNILQNDYLINSVRKGKRYAKWAKKAVPDSDIELVQVVYKCNTKRATEILRILTPDQINYLKTRIIKGGSNE